MKYLLTTLNTTESKARAVRDYILLGFKIDPRDIRFNKDIPTITKVIGEIDPSDREIIITERVNKLMSKIATSLKVNISVESIEEVSSGFTFSIRVEEELISVNL